MRVAGVGRRDLAALAAIALVALGLLWRVTLGGQVLLPTDDLFAFPPWRAYATEMGVETPHNELIADLILQNYSWKRFAREQWLAGNVPLWNPYIFCGMPFLAAGQYGALYPLGVLFYTLPLAQAYGWFIALHLFLGGAFMYFLCRLLGTTRPGALLGGMVFALCGFLVVSFTWPMVVSTAVWAPLLLACVELVLRGLEANESGPRPLLRHPLMWLLVGAVAVALQFLAGHLEISLYVLFTAGFYAAARLAVRLWQTRQWGHVLFSGAALLAMVGLGTGLAAVQLVPFYELIRGNYRAGAVSYSDVVGWALPMQQLLAFVVPNVFGNPTHHSYFDLFRWESLPVVGSLDGGGAPRSYPFWGVKNYVEGTAYVGLLPLALSAAALWLRRDRSTLIFGVYAVFSLLLAFGAPLYALFFFLVPGFDQLHTPFRWVFPYTICVAALAALGLTALQAPQRAVAGRRLGALLLVLASLTTLGLVASRILPSVGLGAARWAREQSPALSAAFPSAEMLYSYQAVQFLLFAGLLALGGAALWALARSTGGSSPRRQAALAALPAVVVAFDLLLFGIDFNSATDPSLLDFEPPALARLREDDAPFRIATFGHDTTLRPNSGMLFGLQDIRGYDTVIPRRYVEFWKLLEDPTNQLTYSQINTLVEPASLTSPLLDLMNVKYVLTTEELELPGYLRVDDRGVNVYRNEDVLPRAFVVPEAVVAANQDEALGLLSRASFDPRRQVVLEGPAQSTAGDEDSVAAPASAGPVPGEAPFGQATIVSYEPNRVRIEVNTPQDGYLVLSDSYFPGWRASSAGRELPLLRADYIYRAVPLKAGRRLVEMEYSPDSFKLGLYGSFISAVLFLLGLAYLSWSRLYRPAAGEGTARRVLKNSLTPMAAQMVGRVVDFGFTIFMLRYLGHVNAGKYAFAVVLIGYFAIFTDFGLGTLLTRDVARAREQANRYLANTLMLRMGLVLASVPVLLGAVGLYHWKLGLSSETALTVLLFGVSLVPSGVAAALSSVFMAHERMEVPAAVNILTAVLRASLGVAALLAGWGIVGLAAASVAASSATAVIFFVLVTRAFFRPRWEADLAFQRQMVGTSAPLMVNNFLSTIFFRVDVVLLQPMRGAGATGYYTTAYKFIDALNIIPSFFTLALFPVMSRYAESARERLLRTYALSLKALLILAMPLAVGIALVADQLILLFFSEEYAASIGALRVLIWFLPLSYVNSLTQYVLIAVNQQRFLTWAFLAGAAFNLLGNLWAIPTYGFLGAAYVTIASEFVLLVPFLYATFKHVGRPPLAELVLRPAGAAAVMGLVLLPLREVSFVLLAPLGLAVYVALLFLLRAFNREDLALVRALRAG